MFGYRLSSTSAMSCSSRRCLSILTYASELMIPTSLCSRSLEPPEKSSPWSLETPSWRDKSIAGDWNGSCSIYAGYWKATMLRLLSSGLAVK